jgi:hypothetical protein
MAVRLTNVVVLFKSEGIYILLFQKNAVNVAAILHKI